MSKQVQLSDHIISQLDNIRTKYNNCSYSRAVKLLIENDRSPRAFVNNRITEIRGVLSSEYQNDEIMDSLSGELDLARARILRHMVEKERKHTGFLFNEVEE